jgi:hypothetical protein
MEIRPRRDRILLSDAVVAALLSAGATREMIAAGKAAARVEYEARRSVERPKEVARQRRQRARKCHAGHGTSRDSVTPDTDLVTRDTDPVSRRDWDDIDFTTGRLHVRRAKGGETAVHPISGKELRSLRRLQRDSECGLISSYPNEALH